MNEPTPQFVEFDLHDITFELLDYWCPREAVQMVINRNYLGKNTEMPQPIPGVIGGHFEWFLFLKDGRYQIISGLEMFTLMIYFSEEGKMNPDDVNTLRSPSSLSVQCVHDWIQNIEGIKHPNTFSAN